MCHLNLQKKLKSFFYGMESFPCGNYVNTNNNENQFDTNFPRSMFLSNVFPLEYLHPSHREHNLNLHLKLNLFLLLILKHQNQRLNLS